MAVLRMAWTGRRRAVAPARPAGSMSSCSNYAPRAQLALDAVALDGFVAKRPVRRGRDPGLHAFAGQLGQHHGRITEHERRRAGHRRGIVGLLGVLNHAEAVRGRASCAPSVASLRRRPRTGGLLPYRPRRLAVDQAPPPPHGGATGVRRETCLDQQTIPQHPRRPHTRRLMARRPTARPAPYTRTGGRRRPNSAPGRAVPGPGIQWSYPRWM
jgi:hypothetical protein